MINAVRFHLGVDLIFNGIVDMFNKVVQVAY